MVLLKELLEYLQTYLEVGLYPDYCPNGLQIEGKKEVKTLAYAVSASVEAIEKAIEAKADALLVHHGLYWDKEPYPLLGVKRHKIKRLLENDISLLAYHLPLDAHREVGNNWKAAKDLEWQDLAPFGNFSGKMIGVKGRFKTMPIEAFVKKVESYYGHPATVALGGKSMIESAALISGGSYRSLKEASDSGVDCFVTGNFDEPAWWQAFEEKIHFMALGHSATERVGVNALSQHLAKTLAVKVIFIDLENPF